MSLPRGFTGMDVMSLDEFIEDEEEQGKELRMKIEGDPQAAFENTITTYVEEEMGELDAPEITPVDISALKKQRMGGPSMDIDIAKRPEKMLHKSNIVDENGKLINNAKLKRSISKRPAKIIGQNTKLKTSGSKSGQKYFDLTLPSYQGLFVDEDTGEFKVVKTCPSAGECSKFCYAAKGGYVMFPTSSMGASRTVNFLMNDPEGFKDQISDELIAAQKSAIKKNKTVALRWHDSGDFLSEKYLQLAFDIARKTPEVLHYAYTKQVPMIKRLESEKPDNFVFNFSFGGTHDDLIDPLVDKHAQVVPFDLFKDLPKKKTAGSIEFPDVSIKTLKQRAAKQFKVKPKSIITYDELLTTPVTKNKKWNVLVWKGHGDDAATRRDVLGTYLLYH